MNVISRKPLSVLEEQGERAAEEITKVVKGMEPDAALVALQILCFDAIIAAHMARGKKDVNEVRRYLVAAFDAYVEDNPYPPPQDDKREEEAA